MLLCGGMSHLDTRVSDLEAAVIVLTTDLGVVITQVNTLQLEVVTLETLLTRIDRFMFHGLWSGL